MEHDQFDYDGLVKRYVSLWNEREEDRRRDLIADLWTVEGRHVAPSVAVGGYDELVARVARSVEHWVVDEGYRFRLRGAPEGHHDVMRFTWEMVDGAGGVVSVGTEILTLDDRGKIVCVYQFLEQ